jgi:hypothetical protein
MHARTTPKTKAYWDAVILAEDHIIKSNTRSKASEILAKKYGFTSAHINQQIKRRHGLTEIGVKRKSIPLSVKWARYSSEELAKALKEIQSVIDYRKHDVSRKVAALRKELNTIGLNLSDFV